jgi:hypothetical protein
MENIHVEFLELEEERLSPSSDIDILLSSFYSDDEDYDILDCIQNLTDTMDVYESLNVRQLLRIQDFYNIPKTKKKGEMVANIIAFESNLANAETVLRRKKLWAYMRELKDDKCMKQYVFWD